MGHIGSGGVLIMLVSVVVPEKKGTAWTKKMWWRTWWWWWWRIWRRRTWILGHFQHFFKTTPTWLFATFL